LRSAGILVMLYTGMAMIGTYVWSHVSGRVGLYRMISLLCASSILLKSSLALSQGIVDFAIIRMLQTGLVAGTFSLIISMFASDSKGGVIDFLNSARFTGNALGPFFSTSILAFSKLPTLYLFIAGMTLFVFLGFRFYSK
jgi:hypothetical protein